MIREKVEALLEALKDRGLTGNFFESGDSYFGISCLFGRRHRDGCDSHASMTVSFGEGVSFVKCYACGYTAPLTNALRVLSTENEGLLNDLLEQAQDHDMKTVTVLKKKVKQYVPQDYTARMDDILAGGLPQEAIDFLEMKGCTKKVAEAMRCGWVESAEMNTGKKVMKVVKTLVFPVYTRYNERVVCIGAQARPIGPVTYKRSKYYTLFPFKAGRHVYGEHLFPKVRGRWLFVMEGPLDCLHFLSIGYASAGLFGLNLREEKVAVLKGAAARRIFILLDPDQNATGVPEKALEKIHNAGMAVSLLRTEQDLKKMTKEDVVRLVGGRQNSAVTVKESINGKIPGGPGKDCAV